MNRRQFIQSVSAACAAGLACGGIDLRADPPPPTDTLRAAAAATGRIAACFTTANALKTDPREDAIFPVEFAMLADGNDLKMNQLRPDPAHFDFSGGDYTLNWARSRGMVLRGHTLVWHNALPAWFNSYVNKSNAQQVMTQHITTVMRHYAGRIYSWDVVNEMIHTQEGTPGGLRPRPWLELLGPDYIEMALRTAAAADPTARLVINENNVEHDLPLHTQRRDALLGLCNNLKRKNVPLHAVGLQSHTKAGVPFAVAAMESMLSQMREMGLEIYITELDVDDTQLPAANLDEQVAQTYVQYLRMVGPFARIICFEQLIDKLDVANQQIEFRRTDGQPHRPNLFDYRYNRKPAYDALVKTIRGLPPL